MTAFEFTSILQNRDASTELKSNLISAWHWTYSIDSNEIIRD